MHWGVRRYQNPDGTLTSAGRKRYASETLQKAEKTLLAKNYVSKDGYQKQKKISGATNDSQWKAKMPSGTVMNLAGKRNNSYNSEILKKAEKVLSAENYVSKDGYQEQKKISGATNDSQWKAKMPSGSMANLAGKGDNYIRDKISDPVSAVKNSYSNYKAQKSKSFINKLKDIVVDPDLQGEINRTNKSQKIPTMKDEADRNKRNNI